MGKSCWLGNFISLWAQFESSTIGSDFYGLAILPSFNFLFNVNSTNMDGGPRLHFVRGRGYVFPSLAPVPVETIIRNRRTRLAGTKARRAVRMIKIIQWFLLYNDRLLSLSLSVSLSFYIYIWWGGSRGGGITRDYWKKNLMLMKMPLRVFPLFALSRILLETSPPLLHNLFLCSNVYNKWSIVARGYQDIKDY